MIVGIHQPNFMPWLGYFRKIVESDVFVFYDNVQMPKGKSYTGRVQIKTANGPQWLTVPQDRSTGTKPIHEAAVPAQGWERKHLNTIRHAYGKSPWIDDVLALLEEVYTDRSNLLADLNIEIVRAFARYLEIVDTKFVRATELGIESSTADSIVEIVQQLGATTYLTGTGSGTARHMDEDAFTAIGCEVAYLDSSFEPYTQFHGDFIPGLSIIDAVLCTGPQATHEMLRQQP